MMIVIGSSNCSGKGVCLLGKKKKVEWLDCSALRVCVCVCVCAD